MRTLLLAILAVAAAASAFPSRAAGRKFINTKEVRILTFLINTHVRLPPSHSSAEHLRNIIACNNTKCMIAVAVCYYGSWATYRPWPGAFHVDSIDASKCTHVVYAFAGLDAQTLNVMSLDPYNDLEENWGKGSYKKFAALATKYPGVTTLLAVGGWNEGSRKYSDMAATAAGRRRFAQQAAEFVDSYGFGGLDLDWEYPTQREGRPQDKDNFVLLLKELRSELDKRGLLLTVAVGANPEMLGIAYDAAGVSEHVHLINLMTFDFYTAASSNFTAPNAPLQGTFGNYSVEDSVAQWLKAGAAPEKLAAGLAFYGRSYTLADAKDSSLGALAVGPGKPGDVTQEAGYLTIYEICMKKEDEGWVEKEEKGVVYVSKGDQWVTYEPAQQIKEKAVWAVQQGLAGVMIWPLESDDVAGLCGGVESPLLAAANEGLGRA